MISRCSICDHSCHFIPGDGPQPCEFLFIGEKPGREEDGRGRPFIGDAGREFNQNYLELAGLQRDDIRITNTVKCRLGGNNNKPTDEQIRACASHHITREVERCAPTVIILMGATACSLVPGIELDKEHGIPRFVESQDSEILNYTGYVLPMFHPAAGMHNTGLMIPLLEDFERMRKWLRGKWAPPEPPKTTTYKELNDGSELKHILCGGDSDGRNLAVDTERDGNQPWSVQFSCRPGHGYLIKASRKDLLGAFNRYAHEYESVILHNAGQDLDLLEGMGVYLRRYRDTMQEAYHLGNLPQGLKALAYRLLGIRMQSWDDLVTPYSKAVMIEWLKERWLECEPVKVEKQLKTKISVSWKPTDLERSLKRLLSHSHKDTYELWEKVAELTFPPSITAWPLKSIAHVPTSLAVVYACQDADVTLQVAECLESKREEIMVGEWGVDESDWDK